MRIGALAKASGTTVRTVRYYEEIGLLPRADSREAGEHREYDEADVERLSELLRLKGLLGLSLDELREVMVGEQARAERRGGARRAAHGRRDVVELEVEEHVAAGLAQPAHDPGPLGREELAADLVEAAGLAELLDQTASVRAEEVLHEDALVADLVHGGTEGRCRVAGPEPDAHRLEPLDTVERLERPALHLRPADPDRTVGQRPEHLERISDDVDARRLEEVDSDRVCEPLAAAASQLEDQRSFGER